MQDISTAPELQVSQWLNSKAPMTLAELRGKVVVIEAFQMLCPGCVSVGLPQAQKIASLFPSDRVVVLGLHSVFEHHQAMTPVSLKAFVHEYRLEFPIGIDEAGPGGMPRTMAAYRLRGTPSLLLIDRNGFLRANHFGHVDDMRIGAEIATLLAEGAIQAPGNSTEDGAQAGCDAHGCPVPETA